MFMQMFVCLRGKLESELGRGEVCYMVEMKKKKMALVRPISPFKDSFASLEV